MMTSKNMKMTAVMAAVLFCGVAVAGQKNLAVKGNPAAAANCAPAAEVSAPAVEAAKPGIFARGAAFVTAPVYGLKNYVWTDATSYKDVTVKVAGIVVLSALAYQAASAAYNALVPQDNA